MKEDINNLWNSLKDQLIERFKVQYLLYKKDKIEGSKLFLDIFNENRMQFLDFTKHNNLNDGKFGGILLEWGLKFAILSCIQQNHKEDKIEVINKHQIPYRWKDKGTTVINIDIVLKEKKPKRKILFCIEVKTNFEDNFSKYVKEQRAIYHHRTKTFKDFKYHYVAFSTIPQKLQMNSHKNGINTIKKRGQLWSFPFDQIENKEIVDCSLFLDSIYGLIESY